MGTSSTFRRHFVKMLTPAQGNRVTTSWERTFQNIFSFGFEKYSYSDFKNERECFIRVHKHEKTDENTRPQAECFCCFRVFRNPDHDARVFEIASQSRLKENGILTNFSHVVGKFLVTKNCIVMVICLFRKSVTEVITMLWMIIKSRFNFEFFTLFCNGFTTFSASKISR